MVVVWLTAAWELIKDGGADKYDVTVLEGTRAFGGISRTVKHNGNRMDIGGHRFFFSKDERIMDRWKTVLPLQGAPSYDDKKLSAVSTIWSRAAPIPRWKTR